MQSNFVLEPGFELDCKCENVSKTRRSIDVHGVVGVSNDCDEHTELIRGWDTVNFLEARPNV